MDKELKAKLEQAEEAIDKLEDKVEDKIENMAEEFAEDAVELWTDIKKNFSGVKQKLKTAVIKLDQKGDEAQLQAHLSAMEAHDRLQGFKDTVEEFTRKVAATAQTELDTVKLRAHLAEMEAEDFWENKGKDIAEDFSESSEKVKDLTLEVANEVKDYFENLVEKFNRSV
jgi:ElaB/YqjD/DUF883 family membrane-anchored ribosome-binding protein